MSTKAEALTAKGMGQFPMITKQLHKNLLQYFQASGMDSSVPSGANEARLWVNRWHSQLVMNNNYWPHEIPFEIVYAGFISAVMNDFVSVHGHNVKTHISAFIKWITTDGILSKLQQDYYAMYPDKRPMQLAEHNEHQPVRKGMLPYSPEVVQNQIRTYERIYHVGLSDLVKQFTGAGNYVRKLYATRKAMIQEGSWPFENENEKDDK